MRRLLCIIIVIIMALSLFGCFRPDRPSRIHPGTLANGYTTLSQEATKLDGTILQYVGNWALSHSIYQGITMSAGELNMSADLVVLPNGNIKFTFEGVTSPGYLSIENGKAYIKDNLSDEKIPLTIQGGEVFIEHSGVQMFFKKK